MKIKSKNKRLSFTIHRVIIRYFLLKREGGQDAYQFERWYRYNK